jgi:tetratricopeptide (TPR) repeat protein
MDFRWLTRFAAIAVMLVFAVSSAVAQDNDLNLDDILGDDKPAAPADAGAGVDLDAGKPDLDLNADNTTVPKPAAVDNGLGRTPEEIMQDEIVRRKEKELEAEQLYIEGREAYIQGDYESATTKFIAAQVKLREASLSEPRVLAKNKMLEKLLATAYEEWAEQLARDARTDASIEDYDSAIDKYQKVLELNPDRKDDVALQVRNLQKAKRRAEFDASVSALAVDPDKPTRDAEVDSLIARGKVYFEHQRFSDAREMFEQALLKDAYNINATRFLKRINDKFQQTGLERRRVMRAERIAEIIWKWNDPVTPLVTPTGKNPASSPVTKTAIEAEGIREKLDNIIIPRISFEEATIHSVITYLKQRSKDLDPDGEGVNIFLQLTGSNPTPVDDAGPGDNIDDFAVPVDDDPFADDAAGGDPFADEAVDGGDEFFEDAGGGGGAVGGELTITMDFDNIPLGEAIRYICQGAGLKYRIERYAVIIAGRDVPLDDMETRIYPVEAGFLTTQATRESNLDFGEDDDDDAGATGDGGDPLSFFTDVGVEFPQGAKISYNARTSKLIVTNTPDNLRKIEMLLRELNVQPTQVTIEAKFVEVSETDIDSLGFKWLFVGEGDDFNGGTTNKDVNLSGDAQFEIFKQTTGNVGLTDALRTANDIGFTTRNGDVLQVNSIINDLQFQTIISALSLLHGTDVLSAPKVTTLSGNTAVIKMVNERFFPETWSEPEFQAGSNSNNGVTGASFTPSIPEFGEAREVGVILEVTPTVASEGYSIDLELNPEVLEHVGFDDYSYTITVEGQDQTALLQMPIIAKRSLATKVIVWDGETVVLGGMVIERLESIDDQVPFLGDVPVFGRLFQSKGEKSEKRNLLIFVAARLVNPAGLPIRTADIRGLPDFRR